jgi:hypothetical protein
VTIVIGTLAAALGGLHLKALSTLQRRVPCPVQTYRSIMVETRAVDLRSPASEPARRRFNAYYGVRRNAAWRTIFYEQFEAAKSVSDVFSSRALQIAGKRNTALKSRHVGKSAMVI